MFQNSNKVMEIVKGIVSANYSIEDNLFNAYEELLKLNIVEVREMLTLQCWLSDLEKMNHKIT